ncbi:hypothetical protein Ait01nite_099550 [Actinoplanes italicus]|uniref:Putative membrane protein YeiB n=1 Tax=Actinoplanes italicus TaxID=113567 RepID=A0A2T0KGD6_9ACTN|nr:DUF418 domain-containing protein [Actinoplanes italicus]PRX22495.1 putative membrane protein YeiB [Actinoplanes italicus]GIE36910.1 hypothetical protein Ait01nite_099550 [Actinoplanes italicus]
MSTTEFPATAGPVGARDRALTPDLARGLMLALIALANSVVYLHDRPYGVRQHIVESGLPDRIVSVLTVTLVDARAYPMFAALFAYGVVQILQRQRAAGLTEPEAKSLLRRRSRWLIVFGFAHALLLFPGDILALYGVTGFLLIALTRVRDRTLLAAAGLWLVVVAVLQGAAYTMPSDGGRSFFWSFETAGPLAALALRPVEWLMTPVGLVGVGSAVLAGTWAARRGILTDPAAHRPLLVRTAVIGMVVAVAGGLPAGLAVGHFWEPAGPLILWGLSALHAVTGIAGGLGYAALIALAALRIGDRPGPVARALAATGERSLTFYLFQSVVFVVLLTPLPYALGLGSSLGTAATAALAVATWLVSVLIADAMRRRNVRGPAEVVLRRLTYRSAMMSR